MMFIWRELDIIFFKDIQQEYQLFLIDSKKIRYINPDLFRNTKMKYKQ